MPFNAESIYELILLLPLLLLSITLHEFAHARTALAFGDPTGKLMGRVSLNPLRHLDPLGTVVLILTRFIGWAKPVPVNPNNLHPRRLGDVMVSLAGPLSNLGLAIIAGLIIRLMLVSVPGSADSALLRMGYLQLFTMLSLNLMLFVFNLLPLWPLDGHHILREALPIQSHAGFMSWQMRYGRGVLAAVILVPRIAPALGGLKIFDPIWWIRLKVLGTAIRGLGIEGVIPFIFG
ncbi:MAG: site-2 protease family protein [Phycisphaerae bacterium]|nr:site-2 protease family protein [Phycisphaerae bacterium]